MRVGTSTQWRYVITCPARRRFSSYPSHLLQPHVTNGRGEIVRRVGTRVNVSEVLLLSWIAGLNGSHPHHLTAEQFHVIGKLFQDVLASNHSL